MAPHRPVASALAPQWLTMEKAAALRGHHPETLRRFIEDGALETRRENDHTWGIPGGAARSVAEAGMNRRARSPTSTGRAFFVLGRPTLVSNIAHQYWPPGTEIKRPHQSLCLGETGKNGKGGK
jgi:hypothetical protein